MISATFVLREHEEWGSVGLVMVGRSWTDPLGGMAVAHDLLEHPPNDDGTTESELMAFGASIFVRDGVNYYAARGQHTVSPGANFGGEIADQEKYLDGRLLRDPGHTKVCPEIEPWIDDAIYAMESALRDHGDETPCPAFVESEHWKLRGWVRRGYRAAKHRYRRFRQYDLCWIFGQIQEKADKFIDHAEEGQRCLIRVDLSNKEVVLIDLEYEDEDHYAH